MPFFLSRNSIIFQLAIQGKTFKISTGITTQNWDTKTKRIAKVEDFYFEKNNLLDKIEQEGQRIKNKSKSEGWIPSLVFIKERIKSIQEVKTKAEEVIFVHQYIRDYQQRKKASLSKGHLKNFTSLANDVEGSWPMLTFQDLDSKWMQDFADSLLSNDLMSNTVSKKIREIKAVVVDARRRGILIDPSFEEFKFKSITYPAFYLDWDTDIRSITQVELSEAKERVRDRFLFRCYTGMREGELNQLSSLNFSQMKAANFLEYWDIKGKKMKKIQLNELAFQIAEKYKFNLPEISQQKENEYIKLIAEDAGITDPVKKIRHSGSKVLAEIIPKYKMISTHTARRSFARRWYEKGGDLMKLSRYLGHSSIRTTQLYIGLDDSEANDEMIRLFK